jgi:hypothetical protein
MVRRFNAPLLSVTTITCRIFPTVGKNFGVDNPEKKWHTASSVPSKNNYNATRATVHGHYYQAFFAEG